MRRGHFSDLKLGHIFQRSRCESHYHHFMLPLGHAPSTRLCKRCRTFPTSSTHQFPSLDNSGREIPVLLTRYDTPIWKSSERNATIDRGGWTVVFSDRISKQAASSSKRYSFSIHHKGVFFFSSFFLSLGRPDSPTDRHLRLKGTGNRAADSF